MFNYLVKNNPYIENKFDGMTSMEISKERFIQLKEMMIFLDRKPHVLRVESYLESMCHHYNLFEVDDDNNARLVAKLVNDFDKNFRYYEVEEMTPHQVRRAFFNLDKKFGA